MRGADSPQLTSTEPRWLDAVEMRAWRNLIEIVAELEGDLGADLAASQHMTVGDYQVLVYLSEAPGHSMRMCDLATRLQLSPSGLTRRLDGLVHSGYVDRLPSDGDRRVIMAVLTEAGAQRLTEAAPDHVAHVRHRMLDHMSRSDVEQLGLILERLRATRAAMRISPGTDRSELVQPRA